MALLQRPVRGVLFDLDDTLFDHNHATRCAVAALHQSEAAFAVWSPDELRRRHSEMLELIHREVVAGRLQIDAARRERFRRLLADAGAGEDAASRAPHIGAKYREEYERGWRAVDGALDLLAALHHRGLPVAVVTNNLTMEQALKLRYTALEPFVDALITSEDVGVAKPDSAIYDAALSALGVSADESVMVGDVWDTDIAGALAAGVRPIWFNWRRLPSRDRTIAEIAALAPVDVTMQVICG